MERWRGRCPVMGFISPYRAWHNMTWDADRGERCGMTERVKVGEWRKDGRWRRKLQNATNTRLCAYSFHAITSIWGMVPDGAARDTAWARHTILMTGWGVLLPVWFFSMKKSTAQERRHTPIDSVILYSRQKYRTFIYICQGGLIHCWIPLYQCL